MTLKKRLLWLLLAGAAVLVYVGLQTGVIYGSVMGAAVAAGGAPWDAFTPGPAGGEAWAWYRDNLDGVLVAYTALCGLVFWGWWRGMKRFLTPPPREACTRRQLGGLCLAGVGLQLLTNLAVILASLLAPEQVEEYNELVETAGLDQPGLAVFVCTALLAPVAEEMLCRGLLMGFFRRACSRFWLANLLQALCFAVLHMNWVQGLYAFVLGLLLGQVWRRYRRMSFCVLLHAVINASGFLPAALIGFIPNPAAALALMAALGYGLARVGLGQLALFEEPERWKFSPPQG